ncbi:ABC transporter permease [Anaerotignum propionicum]|jgi:ribose transport system permease protein|uniref:Monosaccharide ABC transporter membrane protein, CUT2 family n=1 Tax=Anaerotignum propionicum DSM 1682 TaxID=991789 RepID=A0A0X1U6M1_ANAPI|nr:ABC transporter permease [Anaerotignum propionicum]AMJ40583.1 ribose transport system permease protein RbsC [Anaerotignum propionicum DSM 1682]MEA5057960.1 ABC transporter permease [Anaerotignum propionicum]SHE92455.1 monosaccharide ABC transporter membrane protein, CUT2 family [[Clostridium] propionicum DSM 1682] [Anaerotignum propionicum DSM 1682]HBF64937.1 ABC transporter permease [Clostridium sp.]
MEKLKAWLKKNMVIVFLIGLCIGFGVTTDTFFTTKNVMNLTSQMAINALLATGLTYVIILGGIDISVGSVAALAGVFSAMVGLMFPNMSVFLSIIILIVSSLIIGGICGFFNGIMITKFKVVPMITTLATMTIARGVTYIVTGGTAVFGLPTQFSWLGAGRLLVTDSHPNGIIPIITLFTIIVVALMHILLSKTVFGRHVYATGSNLQVAHLSGINTNRVILKSHILCSIMAALGGVLVASKLQNGQPGACEGYEMYAIASTVLGGTSLSGGSGSVGRAMFGVAIIAVINNGMNLLSISSYWQKVVIGSIILLAVIFDMSQKKKA